MDTHRRLWCSWECNDQRQRPIHIAPVPRCRIIIEYDNTLLSLRVYKCNNATPRYTKHARFNRKSQAAGYTLTTRLCANGHKFLYKQVSVLIFYKLFCHWFVIAESLDVMLGGWYLIKEGTFLCDVMHVSNFFDMAKQGNWMNNKENTKMSKVLNK